MKKVWLAALIVALPVTAAQAMTVATFLQKAEGLEKKGVAALFSRDMGVLKGEIRQASAALRAERLAARRAGRQPAYCPPANSSMNSSELLAHLRSIPPAQRQRMEVRDALRSMLVRKYPCPA